jgi:glycosyltransferase involved in cell wall biosynthesis
MPQFINPDNTIFVLLSFEGPDVYSQEGGLGVRVTELSRVIAEHGYFSHLFFIGDPSFTSEEHWIEGKQILHRWCQWISHYHPGGVYDNEWGKMNDWNGSLPYFIIDKIIGPAAADGKLIVILSEDWHTAATTQIIDYYLRKIGLRNHCVIFWNVNNEFGLRNVDVGALDSICTMTTVSRFMNYRLSHYGVNPVIIPNGIPRRILGDVDPTRKYLIRESFDGMLLQKVGRYDPNKRWLEAIAAIARLKALGANPHLIMRGGMGGHRHDVLAFIHHQGLSHSTVRVNDASFDSILGALRFHSHLDVLELDFFIPEDFLMLLYGSADAVLANSSYEPFGIVGLEVMAKGGIAILGSSGEDYATSWHNSYRLQSNDPCEIAAFLQRARDDENLRSHIRRNAKETAASYVWDNVLDYLIYAVEEIAKCFNLVSL